MIEDRRIKDLFARCITHNDCCVADHCTSFTDLIKCKVTYFTTKAEFDCLEPCYGDGFVTEVMTHQSDGRLVPGISTTIGLFIPPHDGKGCWELIWKDDASHSPVEIAKVIFSQT